VEVGPEEFIRRVKSLMSVHSDILSGCSKTSWEGEVLTWRKMWLKEDGRPNELWEALESTRLYPTVQGILKILMSLPVSVASAERTFSCLRRTKTWLRQRL